MLGAKALFIWAVKASWHARPLGARTNFKGEIADPGLRLLVAAGPSACPSKLTPEHNVTGQTFNDTDDEVEESGLYPIVLQASA